MTKFNHKRLKRGVIELIRENKQLKTFLCIEMDIAYSTLMKWLAEDSSRMLEQKFLSIVSKELNIEIENLIEDGKSKIAGRPGRRKRRIIRD